MGKCGRESIWEIQWVGQKPASDELQYNVLKPMLKFNLKVKKQLS